MIDLPPTMTELPVTLYVYEASSVGLSVQESVQVDELVLADGAEFDLAPYGELLEPGEHQVALAPGVYHFRLSGDADLRVDPSAVIVVSNEASDEDKDEWPDPPRKPESAPPPPSPFAFAAASQAWAEHMGVFLGKGDAPRGRTPRLLVTNERRGLPSPSTGG